MKSQNKTPAPREKTATKIHTLEIVFPNQTNHYGTMFGGQVIALADKAAYFAANKYCRSNVVTASMERFDFRAPIRSGDTVECEARVVYAGRSSMVVKVEIFAESADRDERVLCTSGYLTMVALDDQGKPKRVPPLKIRSAAEQEAWEEARKIRKMHTT